MTEQDWLTGTQPDDMLAHVEPRFTPRRWRLLAAAFLRRRWDVIPEGKLRDAVEFVERQAETLTPAMAEKWVADLDDGLPALLARVRTETEDLVRPAMIGDVDEPVLTRPNQIAPAFPLFVAAGRYAVQAVSLAEQPVELAVAAVRTLFADPNRETTLRTASGIEDALLARANCARAASTALRLKQQGDELADLSAGAKNKRLEIAKAEEIVRRTDEQGQTRGLEDEDVADRAVRKALGRFLHELVGNPFGDYRFEDAWRTDTVIGLAKGIDDERAFDRMPILADALLDADCDSEAVLRHLRGTEKHTTEKASHARGCWVLDRILRPNDVLFGAPPPPPPKPKATRKKKA
ncbi:hypothetical protein [Limnoglobus roseus]|uniref:Uncharacterized protein n=1 Tax=Limnoglobus roseus TaxID=2598579 RepID=A0A5C1AT02_9BACT|nr:hypothetical protein [Limnoglobus roseus]QEL20038.1 hypothetical protein PX52LOC_07124 [Limnoglobus roseus]